VNASNFLERAHRSYKRTRLMQKRDRSDCSRGASTGFGEGDKFRARNGTYRDWDTIIVKDQRRIDAGHLGFVCHCGSETRSSRENVSRVVNGEMVCAVMQPKRGLRQ
jgi:hypothetical protein